jgi:hypothetical protein
MLAFRPGFRAHHVFSLSRDCLTFHRKFNTKDRERRNLLIDLTDLLDAPGPRCISYLFRSADGPSRRIVKKSGKNRRISAGEVGAPR